jgi:hypothetical protein
VVERRARAAGPAARVPAPADAGAVLEGAAA